MHIAVFWGLVLLAQQAVAATFEVDLWPEEGRPVFAAAATLLPLRQDPSWSAAALVPLPVSRGQEIAFDLTRYRTVVPGRIVVIAQREVTGRALGPITHLSRHDYYSGRFPGSSVHVAPPDTIEYLQYRAEGSCFVRIAGQVIDAHDCPAFDTTSFHVLAQPRTEWWIRVLANGSAAGWLLVSDSTVRVIDRRG